MWRLLISHDVHEIELLTNFTAFFGDMEGRGVVIEEAGWNRSIYLIFRALGAS
jgi:hypothetical protein